MEDLRILQAGLEEMKRNHRHDSPLKISNLTYGYFQGIMASYVALGRKPSEKVMAWMRSVL